MMSPLQLKEGDVVMVERRRSAYFGQLGVVESLTPKNVSARILLQDGRTATLRVGSLQVVPDPSGKVQATVPWVLAMNRAEKEIVRLREEVAEMKEVVLGLQRLMIGEIEREDDEVVVVTSDDVPSSRDGKTRVPDRRVR